MDLTPYTQNLRQDLLTAASVGDEDVRRAATVLAGAIEPAARLSIMNALSDLAAEVTGVLEDTTVELRLDGRDVRISVTRHHAPETVAPGEDPAGEDWRRAMKDAGGELSRTTVRLFDELKVQAERAAADQGVSLNTYISRAVSDSVRSAVHTEGRGGDHRGRKSGRNISGFIQG
jgi:hypothetical protein